MALSKLAARPGTNLLDNWYFGNPVNQRGQAEYATDGYTIDRWSISQNNSTSHTLQIQEGGINLVGDTWIEQRIPDAKNYKSRELTASVLLADGTLYVAFGSFYWNNEIPEGSNHTAWFIDTPLGKLWIGVQAIKGSDCMSFRITHAADLLIAAVKLETGSVQTLAHKEGDKWVLNEVPSYAEQLARCQRYQLNLFDPTNTGQSYVFQGIATSAANIFGLAPTPVTLAKHPTIVTDCSADVMYKFFGISTSGYGGVVGITTLAVYRKMEHGVVIKAYGTNFVPGNTYIIYVEETNTHKCLLDANL